MHYVNLENFLDFSIFAVGASYILIVYKAFRYNTFLLDLTLENRAKIYWMNYENNVVNENIILLVYALILWSKSVLRLELLSLSGPLFCVMKKIL